MIQRAEKLIDRNNKWHDDGEDQLTGVISTASLGSHGKMGVRLKDGKKSILNLNLQHGDVVTMCDTRLQALTDVSCSLNHSGAIYPRALTLKQHHVDVKGTRRYAMTSRTIDIGFYRNPKHIGKLGTTIEEMESSGILPDRAKAYTYGTTTDV